MLENQKASLQDLTDFNMSATPEAHLYAPALKQIDDHKIIKLPSDDELQQMVADFKALIAKQTEEHRLAAEAITEGVDRMLTRMARKRQEYEEMKAHREVYECEKLSAPMAAAAPMIRRKTRRSVTRQTRKKK